jgi:hypothetical protein
MADIYFSKDPTMQTAIFFSSHSFSIDYPRLTKLASRFKEHISLACLPPRQLQGWLQMLKKAAYQGVITLEVFDPQDLEESLNITYGFLE